MKSKIIEIRHQPVILDADVAELYGVEAKRINEAVKNNRHGARERSNSANFVVTSAKPEITQNEKI